MRSWLKDFLLHNWARKLVALLAAVVIWLLVSYSITVTRTISGVPIRVLNIPKDKTVEGLLPNGLLSRRLTLTVTGQRTTVDNLKASDLEVVTDASGLGDRWTLDITKRNLKATSSDIDLMRGITSVSPVQLTIQLSNLVTEKIPITITEPVGEPPEGFLFLDVWPAVLYQTVSGPEPKVEALKDKGIRLTFNLSEITEQELETAEMAQHSQDEDEIRFFVPESWKRVAMPFGPQDTVEINDPEAAYLHIDFLKQELLPLDVDIPVDVFYPINYSLTINPETYILGTGETIGSKNGIHVLTTPLYVRNVSRLFLDAVRDNIQIMFTAVPKDVQEHLPWNVQFIDPRRLEEAYVETSMATPPPSEEQEVSPQQRAEYLRARFSKYMREFKLLKEDQAPLKLYAELSGETIAVTESESSDS